ncbi:MAG: lysylphosphatidylglycerol synthase transmembrane domain-containing protein [Planctomycetota bacterium]|nr:lysylphosphatidylglycerol synthase transmembrane domain-containing protein [Planctomycetota bacterium]
MRPSISAILKTGVAGVLIYFILQQVNLEELIGIIQGASLSQLAFGAGCWFILSVLGSLRWYWLANAAAVPISYKRSLRLVFVGFFFNNVMFGSTGGDVMRAYLVTQNMHENRWRAVISVIVDRVIGLFVLLTIAAVVLILFESTNPEQFKSVPGLYAMRRFVLLFIVGFIACILMYLSGRVRRALRLKTLISKLPAQSIINKVHDATSLYRSHFAAVIKAFLISIPLQVAGISAFFFIASAIGSELSMRDQAIIFPLVQTASSVPIAPAGWGIGEQLYGWFFQRFGDTLAIGVATSILFRLITQIGFGLVGGLIWVGSTDRKLKKQ